MLKLDDADPIVIKAKKAMVEYKNKNIAMFYLAKKVQLESYTDTAKISNRIIKVYRFVIGAHKRNLGPGDFVIVEEFAWAPNRGRWTTRFLRSIDIISRSRLGETI